MKRLISENIPGYQLLDSGLGRKLELIDRRIVIRPAPQAIWGPKLTDLEWKKAKSLCIRKKDGGGEWKHLTSDGLDDLSINWKDLYFKIKLTSFGHCGVFFEQFAIWQMLQEKINNQKLKLNRPPRFLNLFGYTGCATLTALRAGAEVYHVDSSKGVLNWCKENAMASKNLDLNKMKLIQEDVRKFVQHSIKKGFKYDGILADPPSWGHGAKDEVWEFNDMIFDFTHDCYKILSGDTSFLLLTSHTHGVQSHALANLLEQIGTKNQTLDFGDLGIRHSNDSRILPAGIFSMASNLT